MSAYVFTRKGQPLEAPAIIDMVFSDKRFSILWLAQIEQPRLDADR